MKPGVLPAAFVYCPTIAPWSLMPKARAEVAPLGRKLVSVLLFRTNAFPLPSVPTTAPAELIPNAMAAVELRFKLVGVWETSGLAVKFMKLMLSGVVNPTTVPELEMPLKFVPFPAEEPRLVPV